MNQKYIPKALVELRLRWNHPRFLEFMYWFNGFSIRVPCELANKMSRKLAVFISVLAINFIHYVHKSKG